MPPAETLGLGELKLYTNKLFEENVGFYRRLGYRTDRQDGAHEQTHDLIRSDAMNWRSWSARYGLPNNIVIGVIVGAVVLLYIGLIGVSLDQ